ncbi:MAG: hypothetical protein IT384_26175 [Deltaproteobacteria bacterium]|nr:hypothetical protein [Deltaproteobacteria bacterium]
MRARWTFASLLGALALIAACASKDGSSERDSSAPAGDTGTMDGARALDAASQGDADLGAVFDDAGTATPDSGIEVDGGSTDGSTPSDAGADDASDTQDTGPRVDGSAVDASIVDGGAGPYDRAGPLTVTHVSIPVTGGSRPFSVDVYLPSSAGPHPVVSLSPGLQQTTAGYVSYAERLASHGIITVMRDDPGLRVDTTVVTADIAHVVMTWLAAQSSDSQSVLYNQVDLTRVGLAGHSRGGKASLIAAEAPLLGRVRAWFGIDPVDSAVLAGGVQARTNLATVGVPTAFLGASVSGTCSPAADNYAVLFAAAPAPSVQIVAIDAGHVQFEDPSGCSLCNLCTPNGTADSAVVLAYSVRYLTAFFARELLGDRSVGAAFEGAGATEDIAAGRTTLTTK